MEQRRSDRKDINIKTALIFENQNHSAYIQNISQEGLSIKTSPSTSDLDYEPGKKLELKFQVPTGETMILLCRIVWSFKTPRKKPKPIPGMEPMPQYTTMGVEIIQPMDQYIEFVNSLDNSP